MKDFRNKVAAITGAGSGMGRALALELAARGCAVAIADVGQSTLIETEALLRQRNVKVSSHLVDVADRAAMERFAADVVRIHGKVNLVFNNAGVSVSNSVEKLSYEDFEWLMNINFWGVVHGTKAFLPYLKQVDEAHIVNTSSIFGVVAFASQSAYNASKFAVRGFTEALRQELADTHIGVSCVQPGGVKTNIVKTSRYYAADNEAPTKEELTRTFEQMAALTPHDAALQILRGVERNRGRVLVGRDAVFLAWMQRLFPESYPQRLATFANRIMRRN
ncbi:MAG: SDR family NAD(P)-dependent oxidoreductase [Proteobacteria bacterium]|nr:SDR family NAD(P)-dependent oxidoreductase [Pseudomonadota bacterium]